MAELTFISSGPQPPSEDEALNVYSRVVAGVAQRLSPSVANLNAARCVRGGTADGGGSVVVITPDGFMLTSAYVVQNIQGSGLVAFVDGREHEFLVAGPIHSQTSRFLA